MPRRLAGPCPVAGCPNRSGSCPDHRRLANREHNQRHGGKYDAEHEALRKHYQARMDRGESFICWRCAEAGAPHAVDPTRWDLGHQHGTHRGPECVAGNRATAGRTPGG